MATSNSRSFGWWIGILVAAAAIVFILRYLDSGNRGQTPNSSVASVPATSAPAPAPARDPIAEAANSYIVRHFLKCGNVNFYSTQKMWRRDYEFKGLQWNWNALPVSQADTLNGVEWKGTLHIRCQAYRDTECGEKWCDWESCAGSGMTAFRSFKPDVGMTKRRGSWSYGLTPSLESLAEAGNSQVVESLSPNSACRFYESLGNPELLTKESLRQKIVGEWNCEVSNSQPGYTIPRYTTRFNANGTEHIIAHSGEGDG
ncbi:MAG TPA: hypothetical protein VI685_05080, partial [Candidatus Angelobacter sp.]